MVLFSRKTDSRLADNIGIRMSITVSWEWLHEVFNAQNVAAVSSFTFLDGENNLGKFWMIVRASGELKSAFYFRNMTSFFWIKIFNVLAKSVTFSPVCAKAKFELMISVHCCLLITWHKIESEFYIEVKTKPPAESRWRVSEMHSPSKLLFPVNELKESRKESTVEFLGRIYKI